MTRIFFRCCLIVFMLVVASSIVVPAYAHGDGPRLEINPERLNPGAALDIRGVDFELDEEITLSLVGPEVDIPLGVAFGDDDGGFLLTVTLPADLAEATYVIHAKTNDHEIDSPQFTVWGTAVVEGGDQGEGDSLLQPMPTLASEITPTNIVPHVVDDIVQPASSRAPIIVIVALVLVMGAILLVIVSRRRKAS